MSRDKKIIELDGQEYEVVPFKNNYLEDNEKLCILRPVPKPLREYWAVYIDGKLAHIHNEEEEALEAVMNLAKILKSPVSLVHMREVRDD
jgi:hypothetical protein